MSNPFQVVRDFESALCDYTGAPYAVTTTSCTMALLLAVAWHLRERRWQNIHFDRPAIEIPKRTYVSVPMSIIHADGRPTFRDEEWVGAYQLKPLRVWDSARWFTSGMFKGGPIGNEYLFFGAFGGMMCLSFHWSKHLSLGQGGAILHDNADADKWLRRARFDGRTEGVTPKDDHFDMMGWHCYMSPRDAADGLTRLRLLPKQNEPLPNDPYPDLSQMEIFK